MCCIAIDIGNSYTKFAFFFHNQIFDTFRIKSSYHSPDARKKAILASSVLKWLEKVLFKIQKNTQTRIHHSQIIVCCSSVVPEENLFWKNFWKNIKIKNIHFISARQKKISHFFQKYRGKNTLGADRVSNVLSACHYYSPNTIVIDIGTAITFCIIKEGIYIGGYIFPGPGIALESLQEKTSLLPLVELHNMESRSSLPLQIGTNTKTSIQLGVSYGYQGAIEKMIECCKKQFHGSTDKNVTTILAGGNQALKLPLEKQIDVIDENLTVKGIFVYYSHYC